MSWTLPVAFSLLERAWLKSPARRYRMQVPQSVYAPPSTCITRAVAAVILTFALTSAHAQVISPTPGYPVSNLGEFAQGTLMLKRLFDEVTAQQAQLKALTSNYGTGQILNSPSLHNYLPDQWQSIYSQAKGGSLGGISASMKNIEDQENTTNAATPAQQRYDDTLATNKAVLMQAYQANLARLNNIQSLMAQSNATQDASAKADLQNRLLAEQAMIQNEQSRLNVTAQLQQQETALADEQRSQEFRNNFLRASNGQ
jgi:type IV secretion system protein VirB5